MCLYWTGMLQWEQRREACTGDYGNELIMGTEAYRNGNLIYLSNPAVWYTAEGGIRALDQMIGDLEFALLK